MGAVAVAIFAVGGAFRGVQVIVAALVLGAVVTTLWSRSAFERWSPLLVLLGCAALACLIQIVPLPGGLVHALQPVGDGLREDGAALLQAHPPTTLSLDVAASTRALCFYVILCGLALVALRLSVTERGRYWLLASVAALCALTAIVTGIHALVGAESLFGLYRPEYAKPAILGPLLNENQLGCLMAVGAILSLGLTFYRRQKSWVRVGWVLSVAVTSAIVMASRSRGAAVGLLLGAIVVCAALIGQRFAGNVARRRGTSVMTRTVPIAVIAVCSVLVVIYASAGEMSRDFSRTSLNDLSNSRTKYATWISSYTLVKESPWVGVGRGAFESAFTRVHPASSFSTFSHLENEYLQTIVDWGLPVAIVLGAAALWLFVVAARRWRDGPLAAGAIGALIVVGLQSNFDFGLEVLGLAAPVTIVASTLAYVPLKEMIGRARTKARATRAVVGVVLAIAAALLLSSRTKSISEDREDLYRSPHPTLDDLRPMIGRHPLYYYYYAVASSMLSRSDPGASVRALNHALTLHPTHSGLHLQAAHLLYATGSVEQSTIEYAAAMRGSSTPNRVLMEIVGRFPRDLAARAIPVDTPPVDISKALAGLQRKDIAVVWLARVLQTRPGNSTLCDLLYDLALTANALDAVSTATKSCKGFEPPPDTKLRLARLLDEHAQTNQAIALLSDVDSWTGLVSTKLSAWLLLCDLHVKRKAWTDAKRCLRDLEVSGYSTDGLRAEIATRLATIAAALRPDQSSDAGAGSGSGSGSGSGLSQPK